MAEDTENKEVAKVEKPKKPKKRTTTYIALISKNIGSNPDGTAKIKIKQGDKLNLTKEQEISYRHLQIIK